tara:strand:- start:312 stop:1553 length:1242 start_codon:yes stop_codon:yes gene_type:complete
MAEWKKVIVSGSSAELADLTLDTALTVVNGGTGLTASGVGNFLVGNGTTSLTTVGSNGTGTVVRTNQATGLFATGSFTGSFIGDGSALTGVVGTISNALTDGNGITDFTYDGSSAISISVEADSTTAGNVKPINITANGVGFDISTIDGAGIGLAAGELTVNVDDSSIEISTDTLQVKASGITNGMLAGSIVNTKLVNDSVTLGNTEVDLGTTAGTIDGLTLTDVKATGSFTGSFTGDGSGLTGLASTLSTEGDTGTGTINLLTQTIDIAGGTNINTVANAQTITINLDSDIIVNDAVVEGDLIVNGTASFANTQNLLVADRFVLFASGSTVVGDGGIVVQQGTQDIGELFGFEATSARWGLDTAFDASDSAFTPEAYVSAVIDIQAAGQTDSARYQKNGNIKIDSGDIYIYS